MPRAAAQAAAPDAPTATQEEATRPRPTDGAGRVLDEWGLPLAGPARLRELALVGRADPDTDAAGWSEIVDAPLEVLTVEPPADLPSVPDTDGAAASPPADPAPQTETQ